MSMVATTRTVHYFSLELTDVAVIVCGRHGHVFWPLLFVTFIDLAVVVRGRHGIGPIQRHIWWCYPRWLYIR